MKTIRVKVSELTGAALDYAVAICEGATNEWRSEGPFLWDMYPAIRDRGHDVAYKPSFYWGDGGLLITKYIGNLWKHNKLSPSDPDVWTAAAYLKAQDGTSIYYEDGHTELIAVCRCVVSLTYGEFIEIPEALYGN